MPEYVHFSGVNEAGESAAREFYAEGLGYGRLSSEGRIPLYLLGTDIEAGSTARINVEFVDIEKSKGLKLPEKLDPNDAIKDESIATQMVERAAEVIK